MSNNSSILIIDSDTVINRYFGTDNARSNIKEVFSKAIERIITSYTKGELNRTLLDSLVTLHKILCRWISYEQYEPTKMEHTWIKKIRDFILGIYGGTDRKTLRLKDIFISIFFDFYSDFLNLNLRDPRRSIILKLENWIEHFEELFLSPAKFNFRESKIFCNWASYRINRLSENKYEKVGHGCKKMGCDSDKNLINWININKLNIEKIKKIKNFKAKPNWFDIMIEIYNHSILKSKTKILKYYAYKCKAIGDLILILDTLPNETIFTSNVRDFGEICNQFNIQLITFSR